MRSPVPQFALVVTLVALAVLPTISGDSPRRVEDADRLVALLGHDDFDTRVAAAEKLTALGEHALPALHKAVRGDDPEVVYRAKLTIHAIEKSLVRELHTCKGHTGQVIAVAFDKEGKRCASGGFDTTVRVWDVASGKESLKLEGHKDIVFGVAFTPDGKHLISCSGGAYQNGKWGEGTDYSVRLWNLETGKEVRTFGAKHADWVLCVAVSPDGKRVATGTRNKDTAIRIWDFETGKELTKFTGHAAGVRSVSFSPDGKMLVSGSYDNTIRLWDAESGKNLKVFFGHSGWIDRVVFSSDGKTLLSASRDSSLRWWDVKTGKELQAIRDHRDHVLCVAFLPDGVRGVSSSGDGTVRLWDLTSGSELRRFEGHTSVVDAVAVSEDGKSAASGSKDGTVRLWKLPP